MPLYDYTCEPCGRLDERYVPAARVDEPQACPTCGAPQVRLPISAGTTRKTGVFPFISTHIDGTGQPIVVESLGHLRSLEAKYGVCATGFSQEPSNPESPRDLPEFREGGRAYEGFRFRDYVRQNREDAIKRATRNMELRKYQGRTLVARRGR